jgi:hypothetical protein
VRALRLAALRDEPHSAGVALPVMQAGSGYPRSIGCACRGFHNIGSHAVPSSPTHRVSELDFPVTGVVEQHPYSSENQPKSTLTMDKTWQRRTAQNVAPGHDRSTGWGFGSRLQLKVRISGHSRLARCVEAAAKRFRIGPSREIDRRSPRATVCLRRYKELDGAGSS